MLLLEISNPYHLGQVGVSVLRNSLTFRPVSIEQDPGSFFIRKVNFSFANDSIYAGVRISISDAILLIIIKIEVISCCEVFWSGCHELAVAMWFELLPDILPWKLAFQVAASNLLPAFTYF